jgi:ketosteroid isomerase-like protein
VKRQPDRLSDRGPGDHAGFKVAERNPRRRFDSSSAKWVADLTAVRELRFNSDLFGQSIPFLIRPSASKLVSKESNMKKVLVAVALVILLASTLTAQDAAKAKPAAKTHAANSGGGDVSKKLLDMESKMAEYMKAGNWDAAGAMIDDKAVAVDESGVTDKAGWLKSMSGIKLTEAAVSDMKAIGFGDTYIVTGKFNGKGTSADGKDVDLNINWHDTWKNQGGKWKVIATSSANAKAM